LCFDFGSPLNQRQGWRIMKKYIVKMTTEERQRLQSFLKDGKCTHQENQRARILLKSDQSEGQKWLTDFEIANALDVVIQTVERTRKKFVEEGFDAALRNPKRQKPPHNWKVDGELEAQILMLACSEPPQGRSRWTLRLIASHLVEMELVDSIGKDSVGNVLKKTKSSLGRKNSGA
jgi:transposase